MAGAFAVLQQTDALIIDNRTNRGGDPRTVALYVSYLSEGDPFLINTIHWPRLDRVEEYLSTDLGRKTYGESRPVYVLASSQTFSGGEGLSYDLQALERAVIVGEITGGGAHPVQRAVLGSGFSAAIPVAYSVNPITGTNWEGTGVVPDVEVAAESALLEAQRALLATLASTPPLAPPSAPHVRIAQRGDVQKCSTRERVSHSSHCRIALRCRCALEGLRRCSSS